MNVILSIDRYLCVAPGSCQHHLCYRPVSQSSHHGAAGSFETQRPIQVGVRLLVQSIPSLVRSMHAVPQEDPVWRSRRRCERAKYKHQSDVHTRPTELAACFCASVYAELTAILMSVRNLRAFVLLCMQKSKRFGCPCPSRGTCLLLCFCVCRIRSDFDVHACAVESACFCVICRLRGGFDVHACRANLLASVLLCMQTSGQC